MTGVIKVLEAAEAEEKQVDNLLKQRSILSGRQQLSFGVASYPRPMLSDSYG